MKTNQSNTYGRRKFVTTADKLAGASLVMRLPGVRDAGNMAFGYMDPKMQIPVIQQLKPDLIVSGETREWETVERVRDGLAMGQKTSLLVLSHSVSEEAGMEYAAQWLQPMVPDIKVTHIPSNNPFTFL